VSNAAAIVLYELYKAARSQRRLAEPPSKDVVRLTEAYARALYEHLSRGPSEEVGLALRKLVSRASSAEASAVLRVLSRACAALGCKGRAEELLAELS
jgi:tRNA C32,U32 (ribose-2'-O)-methylase TrmJ